MGQYEILHITLLLSSKKSHFILVYNPHEMFSKIVTEHLEEILFSMREDVFVLGDFNLNLLAAQAHVQAYVDMLQSYGIHFMNTTVPNRPASGSLLDHFSTNIPLNTCNQSIIGNDFTDHSWIVIELPISINIPPSTICNYKFVNQSKMTKLVQDHPFVLEAGSQTSIFSEVYEYSLGIVNSSTTVKFNSFNTKRKGVISLPWVTDEYLKLRKRKDNWFQLSKIHSQNVLVKLHCKECANMERDMRRRLLKKLL